MIFWNIINSKKVIFKMNNLKIKKFKGEVSMYCFIIWITTSLQIALLVSKNMNTIKSIQHLVINLIYSNKNLEKINENHEKIKRLNLNLIFENNCKVIFFDNVTKFIYKVYLYDTPTRFENGDNIAKKLKHKNICKIEKIVDTSINIKNKKLFIKTVVMEFLPIKLDFLSFNIYVEEESNKKKCFSEMEKFNIIIKPRLKIILNDVLHALQYLHSKNLCFSDLKDENLMLKYENDKLVCKLIDFESLFYGNNYNEENLAFTKYYIPVDTDLSTINDKHDIYCLGMLTYLLITGTRLLENPENFSFRVFETKKNPIRYVNRLAINEELKNFIISCLDKIPNARPSAIDLLKHKFFLS